MSDQKLNLVLHQQGKPSPVSIADDKCLIRSNHGNQAIECCAIYSGPNGTVLRSYADGVLVNGSPVSLRILSPGDEIQLPCETKIDVVAVTKIRPVISARQRSLAEVDEQLSALKEDTPAAEKQTVAEDSDLSDQNEESLHSPFSADLEQIVSDSDAKKANVDETQSSTPAVNLMTLALPNKAKAIDVEVVSVSQTTTVPVEIKPETEIRSFEDINQHLDSLMADSVDEVVADSESVDVQPTTQPETGISAVVGGAASVAAASVAAAAVASTTASEPANATPSNGLLPQDVQSQLNDLVASFEANKDPQPTTVEPPVAAQPLAQEPVETFMPVETPEVETFMPVETAKAETEAVETFMPVETMPVETPQVQTEAVETFMPVETQVVETPQVETQAVAVSTPTVDEPSPVVTPVETVAETPVEAPVEKKSADNRSVAEILGAMGMAVPGDETQESAAVASATPAPAPAPPQPAPEVFKPAATQSAEPNAAEDDIQAYMNRLLNRTDGDSQPAATTESPAVAATENVFVDTNFDASVAKEEPVSLLSAEEFIPNHKATRPKNYDALREIANTSSRSAIRRSNERERKGSTMFRLICLAVSLLAAIVMFCLKLHFAGIVLLGLAALSFAIVYMSAKSDTKTVDTLVQNFEKHHSS